MSRSLARAARRWAPVPSGQALLKQTGLEATGEAALIQVQVQPGQVRPVPAQAAPVRGVELARAPQEAAPAQPGTALARAPSEAASVQERPSQAPPEAAPVQVRPETELARATREAAPVQAERVRPETADIQRSRREGMMAERMQPGTALARALSESVSAQQRPVLEQPPQVQPAPAPCEAAAKT